MMVRNALPSCARTLATSPGRQNHAIANPMFDRQQYGYDRAMWEIEKRRGKGCAEYAQLAKQIEAFLKG